MLRVNRSLVNSQDGGEIYDSIAKVDVSNAKAINTIAPTFSNITGSNNVSVDATGDIQLANVFTSGMDASYRIYQSYANANLVGVGWNSSDIASAFYFDGSTPPVVEIVAGGIASSEAFGALSLLAQAVNVNISGIASQENFGNPQVIADAIELILSGISSDEDFGALSVTIGGLIIRASGVESGEEFGELNVRLLNLLQYVKSIVSREYVKPIVKRVTND
jgi:hypothetical protein